MRGYFLYTVLISVLLYSCDSEDAWDMVKTAGEVVTVDRTAESFTRIEVLDWMNLEITYSDNESLTITGPKNIIADISTEVKDGELILMDNNKHTWVRGYNHTITVGISTSNLNYISIQGPGDMTFTNTFVTDSLRLWCEEYAGDVILDVETNHLSVVLLRSTSVFYAKGSAGYASYYSKGTGFLQAQDLKVARCRAHNAGAADMYIYASNYFSGIIEGTGDIFYDGSPADTTFEYRFRGDGQFVDLSLE